MMHSACTDGAVDIAPFEGQEPTILTLLNQ